MDTEGKALSFLLFIFFFDGRDSFVLSHVSHCPFPCFPAHSRAPAYPHPPQIRYKPHLHLSLIHILNDANSSRFKTLLQQQYQASELAKLKYDAGKVQAIYQTEVISDTTVLGTDGMNNYFYTYVLILVLYMMILIYGNQIGVGVASEKSNRAIEILTTSCSPNALIFGKVIAGAIAGVVQTAIMLGSFLIAYQLNADVWDHMLDKFLDIPGLVLVTFALFGILGYLLFSFLFGAIGAMCSKVEERCV